MRFIIVSLFLTFFLYADEIQRMESIVKDVTKLRVDYEECKRELAKKNSVRVGVDLSFNDEIERYKKIIKAKDKKIKTLENRLKKQTKKQIIIKKEYENPNRFPKLALKSQYTNKKVKKSEEKKSEQACHVKASTFRLKVDADIYDTISGEKIDTWEKSRSFTSNVMSQNWIKITGYFVDKKWKKAKHGMWVKKTQVIKR